MPFGARWKQPGGMARVAETLRRIERDLDSGKIITWAAPKVVSAIKARTTSGRDLDDNNFEPYSTRSAAGRRYVQEHKGGRVFPVTLHKSGTMQGNLKARRKGRSRMSVAVVGRHSDLAVTHQRGLGNVPARPWLGMSPSDMRELNRDTLFFLEGLLKLGGPGLRTVGAKPFTGVPWTVRNPR